MRSLLGCLLLLSLPFPAMAACPIGGTPPAGGNHDLLARLLESAPACPGHVESFRALLLADGLILSPTMVANRGFHNPSAGSFSLFEIVTGSSARTGINIGAGEFFFGHFTEAEGNTLQLAQKPEKGALLIELIAYDAKKAQFNFYELIGDGKQGRWFYRGDSADIAADNQMLHRQVNPASPEFGTRLRCSGCHGNGGPIMKELALPHNDWWMPERPLPLGNRSPNASMAAILRGLRPASLLAENVKAGVKKIAAGTSVSLPEKLRPLFCPVELNLESDSFPLAESRGEQSVPSAFFVDPRLAHAPVTAPAARYDEALRDLRMRFPESGGPDADHAWLAPVKAFSDTVTIGTLRNQGIVSEKFVVAILAVDFQNPALSPARCGLLRHVPTQATANWEREFVRALGQAAATDPAAKEALANLTDPALTTTVLRQRSRAFLDSCAKALASGDVTPYLALLNQRRAEIRASEISTNPRGQILEPGFRVIFPEPGKRTSSEFRLDQECRVVPAT